MGSNPFQAPKADLDKHPRDSLVCPYCAHAFPLTWRRYFATPFGNFVCPNCGQKSKLSRGLWYWFLYVPMLASAPLLAVVLGAIALSLFFSSDDVMWVLFDTYFIPGTWIIVVLITLPIDRKLDTHVRRLLPRRQAR